MSGRSTTVERRGDLLVELFREDLGAEFIARPAADLGYDLFVGFKNPDGGINLTAVEINATEQPINTRYPVQRQLYRRLVSTNIPVLLLVADVKQNRLFYALPGLEPASGEGNAKTVPIPLKEVDERTVEELRAQLSQSQVVTAGAPH